MENFGLPSGMERPGVFCIRVLPGSPAEAAGLPESGCLFLRSVAGHRVRTLEDMLSVLKSQGVLGVRRPDDNISSEEIFLRVEARESVRWRGGRKEVLSRILAFRITHKPCRIRILIRCVTRG